MLCCVCCVLFVGKLFVLGEVGGGVAAGGWGLRGAAARAARLVGRQQASSTRHCQRAALSRLQARGVGSSSSRRRARAARWRWRAAAAARAARVRQRVCGCAGVAAAAVSPSATTPAARRRGRRGTRRTAAHGRRQLRQRLVAESVRQQSGRRCAHAAASCAACPPAELCVLCKRCGSQGPTRVAAAGPGALENSSWRCLRGGR